MLQALLILTGLQPRATLPRIAEPFSTVSESRAIRDLRTLQFQTRLTRKINLTL
jgi:hypothetical protein